VLIFYQENCLRSSLNLVVLSVVFSKMTYLELQILMLLYSVVVCVTLNGQLFTSLFVTAASFNQPVLQEVLQVRLRYSVLSWCTPS